MTSIFRRDWVPPGFGTFYILKARGMVRSIFKDVQSTLTTLVILGYIVLVFYRDKDFLFSGLGKHPEFWGFGLFCVCLQLIALCVRAPGASFFQSEVQWMLAAPWSREQRVFYLGIRRLAMITPFAAILALIYSTNHFAYAFNKIFLMMALFAYVPTAIWSLFFKRGTFSLKVVYWALECLTGLAGASWLAFLIITGVGIKVPVSLWARQATEHFALFRFFQMVAESFFTLDFSSSTVYSVAAISISTLAFWVHIKFFEPWDESHLAEIGKRDVQFRNDRNGSTWTYAPPLMFRLRLPSKSSMGVFQTLVWAEFQSFARGMFFQLLFLWLGVLFDSFLTLEFNSVTGEFPLSGGVFSFGTIYISSFGLIAFFSGVLPRIEVIKSLPVKSWKLLVSILMPATLYMFVVIASGTTFRLLILAHLNALQKTGTQFAVLSLWRAVPFAIFCSTLALFTVLTLNLLTALARTKRSLGWQLMIFFGPVPGLVEI